jgi:hypothetical protein
LGASKLSKEGGGLTIPIEEARQDLEKVFGSDGSLSSPVEELDATFLDFAEDLPCEPTHLRRSPMDMANPAPRIFIMDTPAAADCRLFSQLRTIALGE